MTREEAISVLNTLASFQGVIEYLEQHSVSVQDACNMAIQALSQEPTKREIEREYLFQSLCEDFKKLQAENDDLRKRLEQEPCDDILTLTERVATQVTEDMDNFIFTTIKPWCEEKEQRKISKRDLEQALTQYFSKEPCDDAVSRQYLLDNCVVDKVTMPYVPVSKIKNAPPVTQKSGKWRPVYQGDEIINYRCSECEFGNTLGKSTYRMNYCPNCGAKMESEVQE